MIDANLPERVQVTHIKADTRLDAYLHGCFPSFSRTLFQKAIEQGSITLNGRIVKKRVSVKTADCIEIDTHAFDFAPGHKLIAQDIPLDILWRDEYCAAINKPAGLVVHPGHGNRDGTLVNSLLFHLPDLSEGSGADRPGIVHRLDKDTSGVLLVALSNRSHLAFADLFASRKVAKTYLGFCIGTRPADHGTIDEPLGRSTSNPLKRAVSAQGKESRTEFWLLGHRGGISFVRFKLHTGRTHQIRVHCSHAGFPIVGDRLYGGGVESTRSLEPLERRFAARIMECFGRQALHAWSVGFEHPFTHEQRMVVAPLPDDFRRASELFGVTPEE
jgi:23S rRNA pseudouridine1911/1915/1917 synthase